MLPCRKPSVAVAIGVAIGCVSAVVQAQPSAAAAAPAPSDAPPPPPAFVPPPPPSNPPPAASSPRVGGDRVHFQPLQPDVSLLMLRGETPVERLTLWRHGWWYSPGLAPRYAPLCDGPCDVRLGAGAYSLALSKAGGPPVVSRRPIVIDGPSDIHGEYVDRSGLRVLGGAIGTTGTVGGIVMMVASDDRTECGDDGYCYHRVNGPLLAGGIALVVASAVVGSVLLLQADEARFTVAPLTLPAVTRRESPLDSFAAEPPPQGAAFALHF